MCRNEILISIIIPCYNCSKWLPRTLDSLINQRNKNFEVVFIDDGSNDNSFNIAKDILEGSNLNYKIISQENSGVSVARNLGIEKSLGEYIYFLDADDYLDIDFCEYVENNYNENVDIIFFNYSIEDNNKVVKELINSECGLKESMSILEAVLNNKFIYHMCSMLVRRKIVIENVLLFQEGCRYGEDHEFIVKCICNATLLQVSDKKFFYYCMREESAIHTFSVNRLDSIYAALRVEKYISNFLNNAYISTLSKKYVANKMLYNLRQFARINNSSSTCKNVEEKLVSLLTDKKSYFNYLDYEDRNIKTLFMKYLLKSNLKVYLFILSFVKK